MKRSVSQARELRGANEQNYLQTFSLALVHTVLPRGTPRARRWLRPLVDPVDNVALDIGDRPHVVLVLAALYEARQAGRVQGDLGVAAVVGLQPGVLQARGRRGPPAEVFLQGHVDEVSGGVAHAAEVLVREAEVHPAHVDTGLLLTLVQEGGHPTEHDVRQNPDAPDVCAQGDGDALDHFRGGELGVPQQVVDVEVPRDLDGILQVDELHPRHWDA